jgi:hypothetical protein
MSARIERLQGEGVRLIWPASKIEPIAADIVELKAKLDAAIKEGRGFRLMDRQIYELRRDCARAFATANDWTLAKTAINTDKFFGPDPRHIIRHPDSFRWAGRGTAALVVHTYVDIGLAELPAHLTVDRLPDSWYWSGHTSAYCFRT